MDREGVSAAGLADRDRGRGGALAAGDEDIRPGWGERVTLWARRALTGQEETGPRKDIFYFSDDGDLTALRYQDWKVIFMEQRAEATFQAWREPFVTLRIPLLVNLRRDPYERGMVTSNTYDDWFLDRPYLLLPAQAYVAKFLETFKEFPPSQKAASFNLSQVMEKLSEGGGGSK